ncbi:hypothetical protein GCM10020255_074870 [Rhodococcus baikonurensis]
MDPGSRHQCSTAHRRSFDQRRPRLWWKYSSASPSRRADAQDLFFDGRIAHVATIHEDVDGDIHVGVTLLDDPAADLHNWYGRYLYFAPEEIEPMPPDSAS